MMSESPEILMEMEGGRLLGGTEQNWCRAVTVGTGITVLALQLSKEPNISHLQNALHKLQNTHPILNSILYKNPKTSSFSFITPPTPQLKLNTSTPSQTSQLLLKISANHKAPLRTLLEHEMSINPWSAELGAGTPTSFAHLYALPGGSKWAVVLRFHTASCDRTTAVSLLKELMELVMGEKEEEGGTVLIKGMKEEEEVSLGIEDMVPRGKTKKSLWAHGVDMLSYSLNSFRLTNLKFKDVKSSTRVSQMVRLQMNKKETELILAECKGRGIKLCGALVAAGLLVAYSSSKSSNNNQRKKYGVVTLIDCRSSLQPPLTSHNFGFYHSAILNSHDVKAGENVWDLAKRTYMAFAISKNSNKHFTDMADLNYLMCKAIDNPSLTPSSSLRSSLITVFEDPVHDKTSDKQGVLGVDDYIGCASVHGIGPSIAIFDTIRNGELDCACVYPSPLHSREQMQEFVSNMKMALIHGLKSASQI